MTDPQFRPLADNEALVKMDRVCPDGWEFADPYLYRAIRRQVDSSARWTVNEDGLCEYPLPDGSVLNIGPLTFSALWPGVSGAQSHAIHAALVAAINSDPQVCGFDTGGPEPCSKPAGHKDECGEKKNWGVSRHPDPDRMFATVYERMAWKHDIGDHNGSPHPYQHCPRCEMEHPEGSYQQLKRQLELAAAKPASLPDHVHAVVKAAVKQQETHRATPESRSGDGTWMKWLVAVRETEKAVEDMKKVDAEAALKTTDPDA